MGTKKKTKKAAPGKKAAKPTKAATNRKPVRKAAAVKARPGKKPARPKPTRTKTKKTTVVKKTPPKKPAAKPAPARSVATKAASRTSKVKTPAPAKPAPAKPESAKPAPARAAAKPASAKTTPAKAAPAKADGAEMRKRLRDKARGAAKQPRPVAFTLDDVRGELARSTTPKESTAARKGRPAPEAPPAPKAVVAPKIEKRHYGAASLADILGYNPTVDERPADEESRIDKKFLRYYRQLVELRDHVNSGLQLHAEDTLKRSSREDSGDLSGYGQHMADAGTDTFDRDFALSLVSNEQEALYEIEEAIKRIKNGTYGVCELTGKPISKDRLSAVPFARFSIESQIEIEKNRRHTAQRGGIFADAAGEEGAKLLADDSD